jgi:hypothetical protein
MCSFPQPLQETCGSGKERGGEKVADVVLASCASIAVGSVVDRVYAGCAEIGGGVRLYSTGLFPVGSVVRRELGGTGSAEVGGAVGGGEDNGRATTAVVLAGLSDVGRLNPVLRGELGLEDAWA